MSRVFVATDAALERRVVVKAVAPEIGGAVSTERFRREIRLAASLQQANIVPVLSAGDSNGVPYYMMPFVDGESLRARLAVNGRLTVSDAIGVLRDVARALAYAHERGVVHRDIKPDNILLSGRTAVVTDFGIAKAIEVSRTQDGEAALTQLGAMIGTPAYMAPEQALGDAEVDHRADLYAFGVLAYELLTGALPFDVRGSQALVAAHIASPPRDIRESRQDLPPALAAVVMRCLEKDPADRPTHARQVLEVLDGVPAPLAATVADTVSKPSVLVLPFVNLSPAADDAFFADGLTDELITDLSGIAALSVVPLASAMRYRNTDKEPAAVARALGVRFVLDGSVRRAGSTLRLTVRLTDARDGSVVWSDKLGGAIVDVFAMQEQVSRTIVDALSIALTPRESARRRQLAAARARNAGAVEAYLKARNFHRQATGESLPKAVEYYQRAVDVDPEFASAWAGLSFVLVMLTFAWGAWPALTTMPRARAAARRALELDPDLPEAHISMGQVATYHDWDPRAADRCFEEALRLNPNSAEAHAYYVSSLIWLDTRFDEGVRHGRRAVELDPVEPFIRLQLCCAHYFGRDYEAALAEGLKLVEIEPLWGMGHYWVGTVFATCGQAPEAIASIERAIGLDGPGAQHTAWLGNSHAIAGNASEAASCLAQLDAQERDGRNVWAWKLVIHSARGEVDGVMSCLERAYAERSASLVFHLTHPLVDCVRHDARFRALLDRMHLPHLTSYRPERAWFGPMVSGQLP